MSLQCAIIRRGNRRPKSASAVIAILSLTALAALAVNPTANAAGAAVGLGTAGGYSVLGGQAVTVLRGELVDHGTASRVA